MRTFVRVWGNYSAYIITWMTLSISSFEKAAKRRLKEGNCTYGNDFFFLFPCIICGVKIGKLEINKNVRETTLLFVILRHSVNAIWHRRRRRSSSSVSKNPFNRFKVHHRCIMHNTKYSNWSNSFKEFISWLIQ